MFMSIYVYCPTLFFSSFPIYLNLKGLPLEKWPPFFQEADPLNYNYVHILQLID